MQLYIRSILIVIGLVLLQTTFIPFISVGGYLPDLFILYIVVVAVRRGQIEATITGFIIGLLQDILAIRFFGLTAFSKTVAGFVVGYFYNDNTVEQNLGSYRYVLLIGLCSIIHNILYFTIFYQGSESAVFFSAVESTLGMTLYTCIVGVLPMFFFSRKYNVSLTQ